MNTKLRFADDLSNWNSALEAIMKVPCYRKLFSATSSSEPVVVPNMELTNVSLDCANRQDESYSARIAYMGRQISGWMVYCKEIYEDCPDATCILSHHSNVHRWGGSVVNPFYVGDHKFHIFLPDEHRGYSREMKIEYNQRVIFTEESGGYSEHYSTEVDAGEIYFARGLDIARGKIFEKFEPQHNEYHRYFIEGGMSAEQHDKWLRMCTDLKPLT